MARNLYLVPALLLLAGPTLAASPDPTTLVVPPQELSKARELVQQLGSEQFTDREQAERELEKMGRIARTALLEGVNGDPNAEVRSRCHSLLPRATALEMKARLDTFLADTEGKYEHDLPGWNQFRGVVRDEWSFFGHKLWADTSLDKAARLAFAELLSNSVNRQVVTAVGGPESELAATASARRAELYSQKYGRLVVGGAVVSRPVQRREPTAEDIAALIFLEAHTTSRPVGPRNVSINVILNSSPFLSAIKAGDEKGKVYLALIAAWLDSRQDPIEMYNALSLAGNQLSLPEHACRLAVRLLEAKAPQVFYRAQAIATLVKSGNKGHIGALEKAVNDESVVTTLRRNVVKNGMAELVTTEIQLRDVALAAAITLAGEKPEDFGFQDQFKNNGTSVTFSYTRYLLEDDGQRKAASEKWKAWRDKNP